MGIVDKAKSILHMDRSNELDTSKPGPHPMDFSVTDPNRLPGALGQNTDTDIGGKMNNILGPAAVMHYAETHQTGANTTDTSVSHSSSHHTDVPTPVADIHAPHIATGAPLHVPQTGPQDVPLTGMTHGIPFTTDQPAIAGAIGTHGYVGEASHVTPVVVDVPGQTYDVAVPAIIAPAPAPIAFADTGVAVPIGTETVHTTPATGHGIHLDTPSDLGATNSGIATGTAFMSGSDVGAVHYGTGTATGAELDKTPVGTGL